MCEVIIFFILAICVGLLLWVVILDGKLDDIKHDTFDNSNNKWDDPNV